MTTERPPCIHTVQDATTTVVECDVVGITDVADRLGVTSNRVNQWVYRNRLPVPQWYVSGRPAWCWAVLLPDLQERGLA